MNKKVYKIVIISCAVLASFFLLKAFLPFTAETSSVYDSVLRLHIIANSDSDFDQRVKLCVRDALLKYEHGIMKNAQSKEEARRILMAQGDEILALTESVLSKNGADYKAQLYIGNFCFPDREYEDVFYPAGNYEALRIVLGSGTGKNWWCVMFPPLCINTFGGGKNEQEEVRFKSLLLDFIKRISGGELWNTTEERSA